MVILLIFLLLIGSLVIWYVRDRRTRTLWAMATAVALLSWFISLALIVQIPQITRISVWQPQSLFQSQLQLQLDRVSWPFLYASATVLLAIQFTQPARAGQVPKGTRALVLAYAALPMIAMLSANILTVATTWALMDGFTLILGLGVQEDEQGLTNLIPRLIVDGGSVLLLLAAALVNIANTGDSSLTSPLVSPLAAVLLVFAVSLRLGLLPLHFNLPPIPRLRRELGTLLRLLPASAALSVLARMMSIGMPAQVLPWLRVAGGIGVIIGGLRWAFETDSVAARPFLVLAISGLGILIASSSPLGGEAIVAAGVMLLLIGALVSLIEIYSPAHRLWPVLCAAILSGFPWTPGGVLASGLAFERIDTLTVLTFVLGILGMVLLSAGALRTLFAPVQTWTTAESLARFLFGLGLGLPVLGAIGLGFWMSTEIEFQALLFFLISAVLTILFVAALRRLPYREFTRWGRIMTWLDPAPVYRLLALGSRVVMIVVRATSGVMEGEGALLWMYVILLLLFLGIRGIA